MVLALFISMKPACAPLYCPSGAVCVAMQLLVALLVRVSSRGPYAFAYSVKSSPQVIQGSAESAGQPHLLISLHPLF